MSNSIVSRCYRYLAESILRHMRLVNADYQARRWRRQLLRSLSRRSRE